MKNTNNELQKALLLMDKARDLQEKANDAVTECLDYLENHTDKFLYQYGTDVRFYMNLREAIEEYIGGDHSVADEYKTLEYDIKEAMGIEDY